MGSDIITVLCIRVMWVVAHLLGESWKDEGVCVCVNYPNQGENIVGKIQPPDGSKMYLNIASMTHVSREFKTVVSTDRTLQIPKNHVLKCSFTGLTAEKEDRRVTRIV